MANVDGKVQEDCEGDHKEEEDCRLLWVVFPVCHGVDVIVAVSAGRKNN